MEKTRQNVAIRWNKQVFEVGMEVDANIGDLKRRLAELTKVEPKRQKFVGLGRGFDETTLLVDIKAVQKKKKIMMVGTPEKEILPDIADIPPEELSDVVDDFDVEYDSEDISLRSFPVNATKLQRRIESTNITYINAPRKEKPLLVLDLDYTLFDMKSKVSSIETLMRPYLHQFLKNVYPHYNLCVWSQTSWKWLEMKLTALGMLSHPAYSICFVLDKTSMFKIARPRGDERPVHEVKPLEVIWKNASWWNAKNTMHVDDLGRNFALQPQNGLKIKAFKNALVNQHKDMELVLLERYLLLVAKEFGDDFSKLKHSTWKEFLRKRAGF